MKQTAVEKLLEELNGDSFQELCSNHKYIKDYLESRIKSIYLEIEKQQIGYSEEDLKYAFEQGKLYSNICYSRTFENILEIIKIKKK